MITRRKALRLLSSSVAACFAPSRSGRNLSLAAGAFAVMPGDDAAPALAPGAPNSPERLALIATFKKQSEGLEKKFEARTHKSDWTMPYRLFHPESSGKLPLVVYLHGSGGLGDDNEKQLGLGNIFGTRVWLLPENQKRFPCYVVVPQSDRGWARYDFSQQPAAPIPGLGEGNRLALEIVGRLSGEFKIDERRVYVTGQSMGGAGVWNIISNGPRVFAAAVPLCGSLSSDDGTAAIDIPVWDFHGDSDQTVPVTSSRERIAARRKAGGHPLYTEYAGVDHDVWQWGYTEPLLPNWLFAQRRA